MEARFVSRKRSTPDLGSSVLLGQFPELIVDDAPPPVHPHLKELAPEPFPDGVDALVERPTHQVGLAPRPKNVAWIELQLELEVIVGCE